MTSHTLCWNAIIASKDISIAIYDDKSDDDTDNSNYNIDCDDTTAL